MSVELYDESGPLGQFSSNQGYSDLIRASADTPVLEKFFRDASAEDDGVAAVEKALNALGGAADVVKTARQLAALMRGRDLVFISNGTGGGDADVHKSVGGTVIECVATGPDRLWVNTVDAGGEKCAVFCSPRGNVIQVGDGFWWQGGTCHWTAREDGKATGAADVPLPKVGFSGVDRPVGKAYGDDEWASEDAPSGDDSGGPDDTYGAEDEDIDKMIEGDKWITINGQHVLVDADGRPRSNSRVMGGNTGSESRWLSNGKLNPNFDSTRQADPDGYSNDAIKPGEVAYHGTSVKAAKSILQEGLKPSVENSPNAANWACATLSLQEAKNYATGGAGGSGRRPGGDAAIVVIDVKKSGMKGANWSESYRVSRTTVPPEAILRIELYHSGNSTPYKIVKKVDSENEGYIVVHLEEERPFLFKKSDDVDWEVPGVIVKRDDAQHLVFGWFSVTAIAGKSIIDTQGDVISSDTLEEAAYDFVLNARKGGEMHQAADNGVVKGIGRLVESCVFTLEKQKAMLKSLHDQGIAGAELDLGAEAWWGGFRIDSEDVWKKIVSGELRAFSIGGKGKRASI